VSEHRKGRSGKEPLGTPAGDSGEDSGESDEEWLFPFEAALHAVAPGLHEAQNAWLAQIDSLRSPDRKTHELIRLACTVALRNRVGVERHAMLAAEVGATWEEIAGSVVLTEPAFGLLAAVAALPWARRGWEKARAAMEEEGAGGSQPSKR
jgi:alkylhydroperoxidase/carboxymuconolactone decarboxylase family protein YurZ